MVDMISDEEVWVRAVEASAIGSNSIVYADAILAAYRERFRRRIQGEVQASPSSKPGGYQ
jgi:hypothetical protein